MESSLRTAFETDKRIREELSMVVCRRPGKQEENEISNSTSDLLVSGGPIFLPRRNPSRLAERLLAELSHEAGESTRKSLPTL